MPRTQRLALLGLAVVVAVVAIVAISGSGGGSSSTSSGPVLVRVRHEQPVGGVQRIDVKQGRVARFTVESDSAQEIHVHGYDVHEDVTAGGRVAFAIPAKDTGVFVVELERPGVQIASLHVNP